MTQDWRMRDRPCGAGARMAAGATVRLRETCTGDASKTGRGAGLTSASSTTAAGAIGFERNASAVSRAKAGVVRAKLAATRNSETEPSPLQRILRAIEKALVSKNITFMISELTRDRNNRDSV